MSLFEKSFYILRANPALSGNVKLVIDSKYNLYLESFNSNKVLQNKRFKHFGIRPEEYWKETIFNFFENIEAKTVFEVSNIDDKSDTYTNYQYQFDDIYFSGASRVEDNYYQEENEYLAPLYFESEFPSDFIILRVDGAGDVSSDTTKENFRSRIVDKWKFVSGYDLTTKSILGKWLDKNFIKDESFPKNPMYISHGETDLSQISGLDIKHSGWSTRYLNLFEIQSNNTPIFRSEEYFTNIWETNNLLYPHLLNLKFLFDDTPATPTSLRKYSFNRYLGFYGNKILTSSVSPYKCFDLNVPNLVDIINYTEEDCLLIPYIYNNKFVKQINGRLYSFDPIKNGWKDGVLYYIEYNKKYYRLDKVLNDNNININNQIIGDINNQIIGDYLYTIISDIKLERSMSDILETVSEEVYNGLSAENKNIINRILIIDLGNDYDNTRTTYKDRINISNKTFTNIEGYNVINNSHTELVRFKRIFDIQSINNQTVVVFTIEQDISSNIFDIPNFSDSDLFLMQILDKTYVIKKFNGDTPNLANQYYLLDDSTVNVNEYSISYWINNGNISLDSKYYTSVEISNITINDSIPNINIYRFEFSDIKDFDFDRISTDQTVYEYEKEYELPKNIEPKFYAKDFRQSSIDVHRIVGDKARRVPVLDENDRPLFYRNELGEYNLHTSKAYTEEDLYFKDIDGFWQLYRGFKDGTNWFGYEQNQLSLGKEFYREEDYIYRVEDDADNILVDIDFLTNTDKSMKEELTWGVNSMSEISDPKIKLPEINATDPNKEYDKNYIPVSSEYIASDELWELRNNELTKIWDKNQSIVKWGAYQSNGQHDYSYRLNYSLTHGVYNIHPNLNSTRNYPERTEQNLDYFYRFGLLGSEYLNQTLHINTIDNEFDIDKYLSSYNYFEYLFRTGNKFSMFYNRNSYADSETIFRGVKFKLTNIDKVVFNETDNDIIDDILTKATNKYDSYKFSIIFSKKKSTFVNKYNRGNNNSNLGIDIYLNDYHKNVIIHLYINTDSTIQIAESINAEQCEIDVWYNDSFESRDIDPTKWDNYEFKINNYGIGLRPRNFKLIDIINIINNPNFDPKDSKREKINFVHIYDDLTVKMFEYKDSDFNISIEQASAILTKEFAYITKPIIDIPKFDISNTLENRKVGTDNELNNSGYTAEGLRINSISDINAYNNYPIAKEIVNNVQDKRLFWELEESTDPTIHRYNSVYRPIFKQIELFKYDNNGKRVKFFEQSENFGLLSELIYSKTNQTTSILKIQSQNSKEQSVYPMVDEFGYSVDSRFIFRSNVEPSFHYESKRLETPKKEIKGLAGYTIHYDGVSEYLTIPDHEKYNQETYLTDNVNFNNYLDITKSMLDTNTYWVGEQKFFELKCKSNDVINFALLKNSKYKFTVKSVNNTNISTQLDVYSLYCVVLNETTITKLIKQHIEKLTDGENSAVFDTSKILFPSINENYHIINLNIYVGGNINTDIVLNIQKIEGAFNMFGVFIETPNYINIESSTYNLQNPSSLGQTINGGLLKLDTETDEYWKHVIRSSSTYADTFTTTELDSYDKSAPNINNEKLWKEFAGISELKRPGRIGVASYDLTKYPIPKNWNGEVYIDILNKITPNSGTNLSTDIKTLGYYGYDTYVTTPFVTPQLTDSEKFDRSTLYHYFEYAALDTEIENQTASILGRRTDIVPIKILNEFYKVTGYSNNVDLGKKGYVSKLVGNNIDFYQISNSKGFSFEPDINTKILDNKHIYYTGYDNTVLEKPYILFDYFHKEIINKDERFVFDMIFDNGVFDMIHFDIPLYDNINNIQYNSSQIYTIVNDILSTSEYQLEYTNPDLNSNPDILFFNITTKINIGSYYNFKIVIKEPTLRFKYRSEKMCISIKTVSDRMKKTSIRSNRRTGIIGDITVEFWVKISGWSKDYETIMYKGEDTELDVWNDNSFNNFTYVIGKYSDTDKLAFRTCHKSFDIKNTFKKHTLVSISEINDNKYHHVAFVVDAKARAKRIYIDSILDSEQVDYLEQYDSNTGILFDRNPSETEMLARFLENRPRFIVGPVHPSMEGEEKQISNKLRINGQDTLTLYWTNVILGYKTAKIEDIEWQKKYWSVLIQDAYKVYKENYLSHEYYLVVDSDTLNWNILLGTDSILKNSKRNFEGFIDELRIWNYVRTSENITSNYRFILNPKSYLDPLKCLIAYFRFDEGQGFNIINDLTNNYVPKEMDKWIKYNKTIVNDGKNSSVSEAITNFYFLNSFYNIAEPIIIDDTLVDWDISGADIVAVSDERSISKLPMPIFTKSKIEESIFVRSESNLTKRRVERIVLNAKTEILNFTKSIETSNTVKWWLFKTLGQRIIESKNTSVVRLLIENNTKTAVNKINSLLKKFRR